MQRKIFSDSGRTEIKKKTCIVDRFVVVSSKCTAKYKIVTIDCIKFISTNKIIGV